jgi:hypothetical protein
MFPSEYTHRKSFLKWCAGIITSAFAYKKFMTSNTKHENSDCKVKMLTEDGRLVEIDRKHLKKNSTKKISDNDIHNWIKPL